MVYSSAQPERQFRTPEEERAFLRGEPGFRGEDGKEAAQERTAAALSKERVSAYAKLPTERVLAPEYRLKPEETEAIVLNLSPEPHDRKIEELISLIREKGVKNALDVVERLHDPHLFDDLHRFLVQYIKGGFPAHALREGDPLMRALRVALFEVTLPEAPKEDAEKNLKMLLSGMEQFYAGMLSVGEDGEAPTVSIEIANSNGSDEFIFYAAVPDARRGLLEKQILGVFPNAKVREHPDDYNIFNETGIAAASYALSGGNPVFPLKTYDAFDVDPLGVIVGSFTKIKKEGEGAAVQLLLKPASDSYRRRYRRALDEVRKGVPTRKAIDIPESALGDLLKGVREVLSGAPAKKSKDAEPPKVDEIAVKEITEKIGSPIALADLRIVASAPDRRRAEEILSDLEASFKQFENAHGNRLRFKRVERVALSKLLRRFTLRMFSGGEAIPLNLKELTTLLHFPNTAMKSSPELRRAKAGSAPAPVGLSTEGILLGVNRFRNAETKIFLGSEDRLRHFYIVGQTGTGKTTLLKNMIAEDMAAGEGICFIDPHGSDVNDLLGMVPPERTEDVIYFDPSETARPMGLNMLEYDPRFPEQKTFVVNEMLGIFDKLFDMKTAGGPMFEQYFRNAVLLTLEDTASGGTLLDVSRVLGNRAFRELKLSRCRNPIVVAFWRDVAEKAGGEAALQNIVPYITSKFDGFLSNDVMRPIVVQERSSINVREIMDSRKILLVNLSKGRLGDLNAYLLGLILVGKILMAALSRADAAGAPAGGFPPFYLYLDEFQNVTTPSIATILSEARKYKLSLTIAHQFIKQLDEKIKDAVFGNVGSIAAFRVGAEDAEFLAKQFEPVFTAADLINVDNRQAYVRMLANGRPARPFSMETLPPPVSVPARIPKLKELSALTYGRPKEEIEAEIMKKYQTMKT